MSDKPFDAEACDIGGQASATNGLTDATNGLSYMKNVEIERPTDVALHASMSICNLSLKNWLRSVCNGPLSFHSNKCSSPEHVRYLRRRRSEDNVLIGHQAGATDGEEEYFNNC
jgi:hypothetical protein